MSRATLLVNLGSPDSTSEEDVRRYLDEFLSDDRVLDLPKPVQQLVLRLMILPRRPRQSAHAYSRIWREDGSPLIRTSEALRDGVQADSGIPAYLAMRYGSPSIPDVLHELWADGVRDLFVIPLYPHYAMSSFETVVARVEEVAAAFPDLAVTMAEPFFAHPQYIDALVESAAPYLAEDFDHLLFSYHGIPQRHLRKADPTGCHCTRSPDCCATPSPVHGTCYRAQCMHTTRAFLARSGLDPAKTSVSFQSRLAGEPWLKPYTDRELVRLAESGVERLLVLTPAFVADCLETLEEIGMAGRDTFLAAGGREFVHIPCMNVHPAWIRFLADRVSGWVGEVARVA